MKKTEEEKQTRARWITVFATFLAFMGIGIVDPILPVIAESIGASHWQVEMLFTAYIFTMAIMMIPSGMFTSRLGDKKMMVSGLAVVTVFLYYAAYQTAFRSFLFFEPDGALAIRCFSRRR